MLSIQVLWSHPWFCDPGIVQQQNIFFLPFQSNTTQSSFKCLYSCHIWVRINGGSLWHDVHKYIAHCQVFVQCAFCQCEENPEYWGAHFHQIICMPLTVWLSTMSSPYTVSQSFVNVSHCLFLTTQESITACYFWRTSSTTAALKECYNSAVNGKGLTEIWMQAERILLCTSQMSKL
jgi:hypothetical protein